VAVLPYAVRLALPESVRSTDDVDGVPFRTVYDNAVLAVASIAVAVVMTVIVARRGPHRPVLALLAGCLMTVLATLVVTYIADPVACYANVTAAVPAGDGCLHGAPARRLGTRAHFAIIQAIIVAAPAMLVAGAVGSLRRRRPDGGAVASPRVPSRVDVVATGATLSLLVAVLVWLSVLVMPTAYRLWLELSFG
jgi:hypothetical protein